MTKVIVDMRGNAVAEDVFERCRLSGTPLVVVAPWEYRPRESTLGARWDVLRGRACEGFSLRHVSVADASSKAAEAVARLTEPGDVAVTRDSLVAATAADAGALVLDDHGREHDDPWEFVAGHGRMREERPLLAHHEADKPVPATAAEVSRLYDAMATRIPGIRESPRVEPVAGARIVVDADNVPIRPALAVARSHGLEAVLVHDRDGPLGKGVLLTDPTDGSGERGMWVREVTVPVGKDAADREILSVVREGDLVFTNDSVLTLGCIRSGASVVDGLGACFFPGDERLAGKVGIRGVRRRRRAYRRRKSGGVGACIRVIDAAESLLGWAAGGRPPVMAPANPPYVPTVITLVTTGIRR